MLVLKRGEKVPGEKHLAAQKRINNKLNPHITLGPGNYRTRDTLVAGERSHHCIIPAAP